MSKLKKTLAETNNKPASSTMFGSNCRREDDLSEVKIKRLSKPTAMGNYSPQPEQLRQNSGSSPNSESPSPRIRTPSSPPLNGAPNSNIPNSKSPHKRTISESNFSPVSISTSSSTQNFSEKQNISSNTLNELYVAATDYIESFSPRPSNASDQQYSGTTVEFSPSVTSGGLSATPQNRRLSVTDDIFNLQSSSISSINTTTAHDKIQKPKPKSIKRL